LKDGNRGLYSKCTYTQQVCYVLMSSVSHDMKRRYSSFALVHSFPEESLDDFFNKLSGKIHAEYFGAVVGPGWLKYDWRETVWNLDDGRSSHSVPYTKLTSIHV
jgi:hypothetical protein